jgi:hypothetical protein
MREIEQLGGPSLDISTVSEHELHVQLMELQAERYNSPGSLRPSIGPSKHGVPVAERERRFALAMVNLHRFQNEPGAWIAAGAMWHNFEDPDTAAEALDTAQAVTGASMIGAPSEHSARLAVPGSGAYVDALPSTVGELTARLNDTEGTLLNEVAVNVRDQLRAVGVNPKVVVGVTAGVLDGRLTYVVTTSDPGSWAKLQTIKDDLPTGLLVGPPPTMWRDPQTGEYELAPDRHVEVEGPLTLRAAGAAGTLVGTSSPACERCCEPIWRSGAPDVWHTNRRPPPLEEH